MAKKRILYVEDEPFLGKIVHETLQSKGFEVLLITDGARVMQVLNSFAPNICVVDIMLPNVDGYTLCEQIKRQLPQVPVIFLTAKSETDDLVAGFEAGATDYIRKPFSMEELVVRINNQLSLVENSKLDVVATNVRNLGKYTFYPMRYELGGPDGLIKLSQREQEIIQLLTSNINKVVDRVVILKTIWGDDSFFNSRTLDVYIRKLRGYFAADSNIEIVTLKGKGYLFLVR